MLICTYFDAWARFLVKTLQKSYNGLFENQQSEAITVRAITAFLNGLLEINSQSYNGLFENLGQKINSLPKKWLSKLLIYIIYLNINQERTNVRAISIKLLLGLKERRQMSQN